LGTQKEITLTTPKVETTKRSAIKKGRTDHPRLDEGNSRNSVAYILPTPTPRRFAKELGGVVVGLTRTAEDRESEGTLVWEHRALR